MDLNNPESLAVLWLGVAAVLAIVELTLIGTFFTIPFVVGGVVASVASLLNVGVTWSLVIFLVVSLIAFLAIKPLAKKLDKPSPEAMKIGANRLINAQGIVIEEIPEGPSRAGLVKINGETWRAESKDEGQIPEGAKIVVKEVIGTRIVVVKTNSDMSID